MDFGWYIGALTFSDPGYAIDDRYKVRFEGGGLRSGMNIGDHQLELARPREMIEAVPGITAIGFGNPMPGAPDQSSPTPFPHPSDANRTIAAQLSMLDGRFVDVLGLRLIQGRARGAGDDMSFGDSVAVVNQSFARAGGGRVS